MKKPISIPLTTFLCLCGWASAAPRPTGQLTAALLDPVRQSVILAWQLLGNSPAESYAFVNRLSCSSEDEAVFYERPLYPKVSSAIQNGNEGGKKTALLSKNIQISNSEITLGFGPGLRFFCDNEVLKTDFKMSNSEPKTGDQDSLKLGRVTHPPFEVGRFNLFHALTIKMGDMTSEECGFSFSLYADANELVLKQIKARLNSVDACATGYLFSPLENQLHQFLPDSEFGKAGATNLPAVLDKIKPDDMLYFYWVSGEVGAQRWLKTTVDTKNDQFWTVLSSCPAGAVVVK